MSKKLFKRLIKKASQPEPKEPGKQPRPDGYNEKQTRSRTAEDTSAKRRNKSQK